MAGWYLAEGSAPAGEAEVAVTRVWKIVEVNGAQVEGEPEIRFNADGGFSGSTGCNRFQGKGALDAGRFMISGPMATTRMACPGDQLAAQERYFLEVLESGPEIEFNPLADEMLLKNSGEGLSMRLVRAE